MSDSISRQDAIDWCNEKWINRPLDSDRWLIIDFKQMLDALPSTEPKTGKWAIEKRDYIYGKKYILTCSECGDAVSVTESSLPHEKYCRNCGSRMKGADNE